MHSKMNPARVDREDERRMLPCRNFLDGYCAKGSRCRFYHPLPSAIPTVIRVPNLPSSFQQNNLGHFPLHSSRNSLFTQDSAFPTRAHLGTGTKVGVGTPGSSRFLGMNGLTNSYGRSLTPVSPTYSEYEMAYAQQMEIQKEKERRASAPPLVESEDNLQNTVFSHIDWKEFLAPGVRPPPPTHVPYMSNSPGKSPTDALDSLECLIRSAGTSKITSPVNLTKTNFLAERLAPNLEFPSTASIPKEMLPSPKLMDFSAQIKSTKPLSAKEELQMKVKQIAKELASEPAQHVQSLDTFFRNYTFQSTPTSSEQDLIVSKEIQQAKSADDLHVEENPVDITIPDSKSETLTIMASKAFASSDSGLSSEFGSGDSASSMDSVKMDTEEQEVDLQNLTKDI